MPEGLETFEIRAIPGIQEVMKRFLKISAYVVVTGFALIGLAFTAIFIGMQSGLFNVKGSIAGRNAFFLGTSTPTGGKEALPKVPCTDTAATTCDWNQTPEWNVVKNGLLKDQTLIARVSSETGVPARLIVAAVIPEQIRFFTAEREVFKRYFEPLKILGTLSQFSLGVSGIKPETAKMIEQHANDPASPFYPGPGFAQMIAYKDGESHDDVLYARLTDEKNHYYSYLYTALYIREITSHWKNAGYDITQNPGAVVTLFNIGFGKSVPKANPETAGAPITVGGTTYSFGELGEKFYASDELRAEFPL